MSKPLDLIIFERARDEDGCCPRWLNPLTGQLQQREWGDDKPNVERSDYDASKRFTDAELAAEVLVHERDHWRDMSHGGIRQWRYDRLLRIRDIASRPNYDEVA